LTYELLTAEIPGIPKKILAILDFFSDLKIPETKNSCNSRKNPKTPQNY
jgi:hypothetical protein